MAGLGIGRTPRLLVPLQMFRKHWFLVGLVLAIFAARMAPWIGKKGGPLVPEVTVKYGAVGLIFFCSGLTLPTEDLRAAVMHYRLHASIQIFTLAVVPLFMLILVHILNAALASSAAVTPPNNMRTYEEGGASDAAGSAVDDMGAAGLFSPALLQGLLVVGCMPPPVSSAVIMTRAVGGNEAAAIFNSALGSFLGIFATPTLLLALVGVETGVDVIAIARTLTATVVLPLLLGQMARRRYWLRSLAPRNIPFGVISSSTLLVIIYAAFCETFSKELAVEAKSVMAVICLIVALQTGELMLLRYAGSSPSLMGFSRADTAALMFCASHKSLTLGIPRPENIYIFKTNDK
eukprot:UC1_evm2s1252